MNDQKIIELLKGNNDERAIDSLYRHFPMTRKLVVQQGGNIQDAEDIFHDALIIFIRNAKQPTFSLTAKASSYLYSISCNLWKSEMLKRKKMHITELSGEDIIDQTIISQENNYKIAEKVLNELGDRCRELLILFYRTPWRLKEIAQKMGYSSENTAKNQKYKCLETAKKKLAELKQIFPTINP